MKIKELTISQLARYLLSLNDEFKKIHEDWQQAREKSRTNLKFAHYNIFVSKIF